jgi:hypothetical protein
MSLVEQIKNAIESYIGTLLPNFSSSQYIWEPLNNSESKSKLYYAIRPRSASFVTGTCNTITIDQDFVIELGDSFRNKKDTDSDADEKIYAIYLAHETIYKALMRDNFNIARVQVVSGFNINEPEVNKDNKTVKIESIFTVRYRTE